MANAITLFRVLCSALLLFCPVRSLTFCILYLLAGVSDMLDGFAARKTGTVTEFGAELDTAADLAFAVACLIRLLPTLELPAGIYVWAAGIALVKGMNLVYGRARRIKPATLHTVMNRVTGTVLFLFPITVPFIAPARSAAAACLLATAAALRENCVIRKIED